MVGYFIAPVKPDKDKTLFKDARTLAAAYQHHVMGGCCQTIDVYTYEASRDGIIMLIPKAVSGAIQYVDPKGPVDIYLTKEEVKSWVAFTAGCGLNCTFLDKEYYPNDSRTSGPHYMIHIQPQKGLFHKYNLLVFTILRYMFNNMHEYRQIYLNTVKLKELLPEMDNFLLLSLAHKMTDPKRRMSTSGNLIAYKSALADAVVSSYSSYYGLFQHNNLDYNWLIKSSWLKRTLVGQSTNHTINSLLTVPIRGAKLVNSDTLNAELNGTDKVKARNYFLNYIKEAKIYE